MATSVPTPTLCPQCSRHVERDWLVCPACLTRLPHAPEELPTETIFSQAAGVSSSTSADEGRFPAGTVLAGRYRVLGLLGKGGMGEVYRAFDLILNQSVALKFLTQARFNEAALARFRNEVRIARQVSHPNVCRVYDIGFVDGLHFLSMEYLDGEDLSSLLRRIGRLPQDKAVEFTRKICAGLNAAHERGVLHRDLKPGNIMIDGRGQVRITDFGLAALAEEVASGDIRSGTPAYMSPEQKAGREVTTRSDIYSLGLVLHEMFTGKPRGASQSSMSEIIKDLDPAIERVINRCLEEDPKRRPSTAINVAMALPGADPIAAALAAGETPLPEMVAASLEKEGFSARTAVLCFLVAVVSLTAQVLIYGRQGLMPKSPLPKTPEVMAFQARELLERFGYRGEPRDRAYGFQCCDERNYDFVVRQNRERQDDLLRSAQPPILTFWYREHRNDVFYSREAFRGLGRTSGAILRDEPANAAPGMILLELDGLGRLVRMVANPETASRPAETPVDEAALFVAAGLSAARFSPAKPESTPAMAFDERKAWTGTYGDHLPEPIRLETAFWKGRPVYFSIQGSWSVEQTQLAPASGVLGFALAFVFVVLVTGAAIMARINLRSGRGDKKGAAFIAASVFLSGITAWLLTAAHVAGPWEIRLLASAAAEYGLMAGLVWLGYLATEPYMRRHWPDGLISWNRLYSGRWRDPLVASHLLLGFTAFFFFGNVMSPALSAAGPAHPDNPALRSLGGTLPKLGALLGTPMVGLTLTVGVLMLVMVSRIVLRRVWLAEIATAVAVMTFAVDRRSSLDQVAFSFGGGMVVMLASLWMFRRFGFLPLLASFVAYAINISAPVYPADWYAGWVLIVKGLHIAVAAWALWVILSAQRSPSTESQG